jgi:DNA-binding beta-propeller fold protein YncE
MGTRFWLGMWLLGGCPVVTVEPPPPEEELAPVEAGPGLGNLSWSTEALFQPIGWVHTDNGIPLPSPDHPITAIKPYGTNSAYMHDGYLFTVFAPDSGFGPGGLLIYDVSDPRQPTLVSRVWEPELDGRTWDLREVHAMGFSHREGRKLVALHTRFGLHLWDLADVTAPERVGRLDLPGVFSGDYEGVAWQLAWQGTYLYVAGSGEGVYVVDTSDPTAPVLADLDGAPNPIPPGELGGFRVGPLFVVGNRLIVSSMDNEAGYAVLDLSDPKHPALAGTRTGLPKFYSTCFSGGRVVTSARGGGGLMRIDDVDDPFALTWLDTDLEIGGQLYCGFQDTYVFQGCEGEVVKVDLSDPTDPLIVGRGSLGRDHADHGQVSAFGNLVYVGNDHGTGSAFLVHDTQPDTTPPAVSWVSPEDGAVGQGLLTRVGVTFTDNVQVASVWRRSFFVRPVGGEALEGLYTVQGHIVNFEPSAPLEPDTTYELMVPADGVRDWVGNPTAEDFTSTFHTSPFQPDDPGAAFVVEVVGPEAVQVGEPLTLSLDVEGASEGEAWWRPGEAAAWVHREDLGPLTHTFEEPGHHTIIVNASNGLRRVTKTLRVVAHRPLPADPPRSSHSLALDEARGLVWTANRDHDSVSALDATTLAPVHELPVDAGPRSVAVDPAGDVWVSCQEAGTVLVLDGQTGELQERLELHPGASPAGLVISEAAGRAYVALEATGELVSFDLDSREEAARLAVGPRPFGLAVSGDGDTVWATRKVSPDGGGEVYEVAGDLSGYRVLTAPADPSTVDGEDRARGVPNYLLAAGLSPDEAELWLPAKQDNLFRGEARDGEALTHETSVRAVVPRLLLPSGTERTGRRLDLNDRAPPVDVAFTPLGDYALLALQGSNRIVLLDAYSGESLGALPRAGEAVEGLVVSEDGQRLYAHHFLSRSVSVHDLSGLRGGTDYRLSTLASGPTVSYEVLSEQVLLGKKVFYAASDPRMSLDGYIACATCHLDGGEDGRVWDFTDRGEGLRNTIDLRGRAGLGHGPLHWTANFDEVQDFENDIRGPFGGTGFMDDADFFAGTRSDPLGDPKAGLSEELDALAAYVGSLDEVPASPWRQADGGLTPAAVRGAALYEDLGCAECHGGAQLTDSGSGLRYDVGTLIATSGQRRGGALDGLDVPTLRGLHATAPYLHDGRAGRLEEVFTEYNAGDAHGVTSPLDEGAIGDLVAWLLSVE